MGTTLRPISAEDLRRRLRTAITKFYFVKKDGSMREVLGTTNLNHVPSSNHPSGVRESSPSVVVFFDTTIQEWRSAQNTTDFFIPS